MNDIKNPEELWTLQKAKLKLRFAQTTISIGGHQDDGFRVQMDVTFEDMVER